jgi:hypothetical protein
MLGNAQPALSAGAPEQHQNAVLEFVDAICHRKPPLANSATASTDGKVKSKLAKKTGTPDSRRQSPEDHLHG